MKLRKLTTLVLNSVKSIDQFGALFLLNIEGSNSKHKSFVGAVATILIYGLSTSYLIYLLTSWITDSISPNIVTQNKLNVKGQTFSLIQSPFYFTIESYSDEKLQSYKGRKLYEVQAQYFPGNEIIEKENYSPSCKNLMSVYVKDFFDPLCLDITDPDSDSIAQNLTNRTYDDAYDFYLYPCREEDLSCITEEEAKIFLKNIDEQEGRLTLVTQEWDLESNSLQTIPQDFYFTLPFESQLGVSLALTITRLKIIRGILFPTSQTFEYIGRIDIQLQNTFREPGSPYIDFEVTLGRKEIHQIIEYPTLPKILTQFSTIFSLLIAIGILVNKINSNSMRKGLIKQIGNIYFRNFSEFEITEKSNEKCHDELIRILQSKCNYLSILHEISRIQIALSLLLPPEELKRVQSFKFELGYPSSTHQGIKLSEDHFKMFDKSFVKDQLDKSKSIINDLNIVHPKESEIDLQFKYTRKQFPSIASMEPSQSKLKSFQIRHDEDAN